MCAVFSFIRRLFASPSPAPPADDRDPVGDGELHDLFCTRERCPFCRNQLITCDCIATVLQLTLEEKNAVDEYIDDSVEPLMGVMERWKTALREKGRIPFRARKLEATVDDLILMAGVEVLLKAGAKPTRRDLKGRTPADLARERGHEELARLKGSTGLSA